MGKKWPKNAEAIEEWLERCPDACDFIFAVKQKTERDIWYLEILDWLMNSGPTNALLN